MFCIICEKKCLQSDDIVYTYKHESIHRSCIDLKMNPVNLYGLLRNISSISSDKNTKNEK